MKARNTALPASRVALDTIGGKTTATLWDGTFTEFPKEISDEAQADPEGVGGGVEYEYTLYQMDVQMRPGLKEAIEADFGKWYAAAEYREKQENAEKEIREIEREMTGNILSTLLDYDFRLMMLEEMGNL